MKKKYFLIMIVLSFFSCQKELSKEVSSTNTSQQLDVYVAGYVSDLSVGIPAYWKNGKLVLIDSAHYNFTPDYGLLGAGAVSIAVSGNDVYLAGYETYLSPYRGDLYNGICWKNGISVDLTGGLTPVYLASLIKSGSDVYVAGGGNGVAVYWKNGSPVELNIGGGPSVSWAAVTSIAVSGTDVYVAGYEEKYGSYYVAKYWKNGSPVNLSDGTKNTYATSIAVSGSDVYVAGWEGSQGSSVGVAKYWKNGNAITLSDITKYATANSVAVSGTDVYVAGFEAKGDGSPAVAKYWKNGIPVNVTDGTKGANATSIVVSGNDIYVAGYEEKKAGDGNMVAKCWKNGAPVILGDVSKYSESKVYSIFLVKK